MYDMTINLDQLKKIKDMFGKTVVEATLDVSIKKIVTLLERNAIKETPINNGRLRGGFQTDFRSLYGKLFNPVEYAIYVHEGTRPHKAPFSAIAGRAKNKGLPAGAIRNSIALKGTKANPFMERAIGQTENEVDGIFQGEIDKLILRYNTN